MTQTAIILNAGVPAILSRMIKRGFGACAAKVAAPYADASPRTVSDWLQRRAEPGAFKLLRMLRHSGFRAELRAYIDYVEQQEADVLLRIAVNDAKREGLVVDLDRQRVDRRGRVADRRRPSVSAQSSLSDRVS